MQEMNKNIGGLEYLESFSGWELDSSNMHIANE